MQLNTILDQIDLGSIALPEFQRGYVWNREQVRKLMRSLYKGYPVGSLLMWETKTENAEVRGDGPLSNGAVKLLLDGQQRMTSLYGIVRGCPPKFFDGNAQAFTGLYFNLDSEEFEFYAPVKMQDNPTWINVTELMQRGVGIFIQRLMTFPELMPNIQTYINRLNKIENIRSREFHIDNVTGDDKTVDIVVDIFNEVNSGGTKLSKGDLALAKICASWADARDEMKKKLAKWKHVGFNFKMEWLLRCVTTTLTGQAYFSGLKDVTVPEFAEGLKRSEKHIDTILNLIASRLGLDYDHVLGSTGSFPLMVRYLEQNGGQFTNHRERDQLMYWYVHTLMWGRYAGSTESTLARDLAAIAEKNNALERLLDQLLQTRGDLQVYARDFETWSTSSRFYPILYMLTRICRAKDWETGVELSGHLLGKLSGLQVHHIFPKAVLYKHNHPRSKVNSVANFTFLTQETNLRVSDRHPVEYFEHFAEKNPGVLESHWIPMDRSLWEIDKYQDFLSARRELLAQATNQFLNSLRSGNVPETKSVVSVLDRQVIHIPGRIETEEEEQLINECNGWVVSKDLEAGEIAYPLVDDETKQQLALLDIAWANGLQPGKTDPVAILLDESPAVVNHAQSKGFRCFTDIDLFKQYVEREILGENS